MADGWTERVYTIETRLQKEYCGYFREFAPEFAALCRRISQDLRHGVETDSKYVTALMQKTGYLKRTVNSALRQIKGRIKALKELQKTQIADKKNKVEALVGKIKDLSDEIDELKKSVVQHPNDKELLRKYKNKKAKLYSLQVRKNRFNNDIRNYEKSDVPDICYGSKAFFAKQYHLEDNGYKTHKKWLNDFRKLRDRQVYYLASREETAGNQMCQLKYQGGSFLLKVRKERKYCPEDAKRNDERNYVWIPLDFSYRRELLIYALNNGLPLSYTFTCKNGKWYVDVAVTVKNEIWTDTSDGCIGMDFNNGFIALTETDKSGNITKTTNIPLKYHGTGNRAKSEMSEKISKIVRYAFNKKKAISIENLKFSKKKSCCLRKGKKKYNEMLHLLDYSRYKQLCTDYCSTYGVMLKLVNPAYTSKIGKQKYADKRKLTVHNAAAYVIARRGQGFKDRYKKKAA